MNLEEVGWLMFLGFGSLAVALVLFRVAARILRRLFKGKK